jgi:hypothetical protein
VTIQNTMYLVSDDWSHAVIKPLMLKMGAKETQDNCFQLEGDPDKWIQLVNDLKHMLDGSTLLLSTSTSAPATLTPPELCNRLPAPLTQLQARPTGCLCWTQGHFVCARCLACCGDATFYLHECLDCADHT